MKTNIQNKGFSLLELALVLVIIGLVVGGTVVGRSLLRSSELQSMASESAKYTQAISAFRDKYKSLPGDFSGATALWGAASAVLVDCMIKDQAHPMETCDGNDNGRITNQDDVNNTYYEQFRGWQHLSNAGFIETQYTGRSTNNSFYEYTIGVNIPSSKLSGAGWKMFTMSISDLTVLGLGDMPFETGDIPPNVVLWLGGIYFENSNRMSNIISPAEAYDIDVKIDNGKSTSGKVVAQSSGGMGTACNSGSDFNLATAATRNARACALVFKTGL